VIFTHAGDDMTDIFAAFHGKFTFAEMVKKFGGTGVAKFVRLPYFFGCQ